MFNSNKHIIKGVIIGNVTQVTSTYPWLAGQTFTETFAYDSTNQLVSAANPQTYALSITYGDWGKIQQYDLSQTDLANNLTTSQTRTYNYGSLNEGQTTFAPNNISYADGTNVNEQYGIGGSLQRRETNIPGNQPNEELYRFGADGNLRMYSYDRLFYSLYGYDGGTTRTYKYSMDLSPNWVNGRLESVNFNLHNAMFYPNAYINFNSNGYYTKHYYNGMERIASRLGDQNLSINVNDPELQDRKEWQDSLIRKNIVEITGYEFLPVGEEQTIDDPKPIFELPVIGISNLQPSADGIYYYHPNHLGSTCYVTDENAIVQQGFLYAPFGEITNEHNVGWQSGTLPKYSFNAKELDEETGMYYYEARYYAPPTFTSRDPLFEKYPTISSYTYCANNPVKYVDPDGRDWYEAVNSETKQNEIKWTDYHSQKELDDNNVNGKHLGKAVVVFDGYNDEKLGSKQKGDNGYDSKHSDGYIDGKGSKAAKVTVYGPKDAYDIQQYTGYTMSSDPSSFGVVADGDYIVNRGPVGPYKSNWAFGEYDANYKWKWSKIPAMGGHNPRHPKRKPGYLDGVYVHPCNKSGWAGTYKNGTKGVSEGCLLIHGSEWQRFNAQLQSVNSFMVKVRRK